MSANIKASTDGTQAIIGVGGVDQMTVSNAGVVTANSFVGLNGSSVTATGSTTARTLANRFADVVNVKDFGAVGDGVADDTSEIQSAIDANPGKAIYFPAGNYKVTSQIRIKRAWTSLIADATGIATLQFAADTTNAAILVRSDLDPTFPSIFSVNILNIRLVKTATNTVASIGIELDRADSTRFINSEVAGFATALKISGGRNNYFSDLRLAAFGIATPISGTSIVEITSSTFSGGSTGFTQMFDNCIIGGDFKVDYVVSILGNDYCSFANCYIASSNIALVRINGEAGNVYDNWFDHCYFDGAESYSNNPTPLGIWIQENSPSTNANALQNFTDCSFGQLDSAIFIDEESVFQVGFSDCRFTNIYENVIACSSNDVDLRINGCTFRRVCSQLPNKQIISIVDASSLTISSNIFQFESGTTPPANTTIIQLGGSMAASSVSIIGNVFTSWSANVTDYINGGATISELVIEGNASNASINTIVGNIIGNRENSNVLALDWYEERTFLPTITFGGGSTGVSYGTRTGNWTRIGNRVNFDIYIQLSSKGSSAGSVEIGTLPFAINANNATAFSVRALSMGATVGDTNLDSSKSTSTTVRVNKMVSGSSVVMTDADFTNSSIISISGVYFV